MGVWLDKGKPYMSHLRMDVPEVTRKDLLSVGFIAIHNYLYQKSGCEV
jgi:hypothetical protein